MLERVVLFTTKINLPSICAIRKACWKLVYNIAVGLEKKPRRNMSTDCNHPTCTTKHLISLIDALLECRLSRTYLIGGGESHLNMKQLLRDGKEFLITSSANKRRKSISQLITNLQEGKCCLRSRRRASPFHCSTRNKTSRSPRITFDLLLVSRTCGGRKGKNTFPSFDIYFSLSEKTLTMKTQNHNRTMTDSSAGMNTLVV